MLTLETLAALQTPTGQEALAMATGRPRAPATLLADLQAMRRYFAPDLAAAALELVTLRERARTKFTLSDQMFFTRDALEQASGEVVARHTAVRFRGSAPVWDVCCSIGGESLEIARAGADVTGLDLDPVRLRMADLNAVAYGVAERARFEQRDAATWQAPADSLVFFDPARRSGGQRVFDPAHYQPPLDIIAPWLDRAEGVGVKVAPGIAYDDLPWGPCEVEIVSLGGDVKEAVLWFGRLRTAERRATLLPSGATLTGGATEPVAVTTPRRYLYEPDGAVIRAHLVEHLAHEIGATKIDREIAFLSTDEAIDTPFARRFKIDDVVLWNLKRLRQYLRERGIGQTVIKKRGSPIDPQVLEKQLRLEGDNAATLVLTHVEGKPSVIVCDVT